MSDYKHAYIQQKNEKDYLSKVINAGYIGKSLGILLAGPPGTGKTLLAITLANEMGAKYHVIDGGPQLDRRDIEGNWEILEGNTFFNPGPLVKALNDANENGIAFLIINEINAIRPSEQISCNSLLSENHINLISKAGERIELNENAKLIVIGTMNRNVLGINSLQEAFNDRFLVNVNIEYPEKNKEIEIIEDITKCSKALAQLVVEGGHHLREMATNSAIAKIFSTRMAVNFCAFASIMRGEFIEDNIKNMIINKLSEEAEDEESIVQMLDGMKFNKRLQELFATKTEVKPTPATPTDDTAKIIEDMRKVVEEYFPQGKIFRAGKLTNSFLEWVWANKKTQTQKYFELTKEMGLFEEYEKETHKKVYYGGALTYTYIYWIYQNRHHKLIDFMAKRYNVLGVAL